MLILLDTHTLIWLDQDDPLLGAKTRELTDSALAEDRMSVSAVTFWEVAMLAKKERIELNLPLATWRQDLLQGGLREFPIDGAIGIVATELEDLHPDPADRLIVATALQTGATLVTADERMLQWSGQFERHNARL